MWRSASFSLALLALLVASPAWAMFSPVQRASAEAGASATSQAVTVLPTIRNNGMVVGLFWCSNDASCHGSATADIVTGVADTNGDACTEAAGTFQTKTSGLIVFQTEIWTCPKLTAANTTFTVSFSGTVYYPGISVTELAPGGFSVDGSTGGGGSTTGTSMSLTTAANTALPGEFIYAIVAAASATLSAGQFMLNGTTKLIDEFQISDVSGTTYSNTVTDNTSDFLMGSIVALRPSITHGFDYFSSLPYSPAGTVSTSGVMAGFFGRIVPQKSGRVKVTITGDCFDSVIGHGGSPQLRYGTGASPAAAAAATGTAFGLAPAFAAVTTTARMDCTNSAILTGLTTGVSYWLDELLISDNASDTFTLENAVLNILEF